MKYGKNKEMVKDLKKTWAEHRRKKNTLLNTEFLLSRLIYLNLEHPLLNKVQYFRHWSIFGVRLVCTEQEKSQILMELWATSLSMDATLPVLEHFKGKEKDSLSFQSLCKLLVMWQVRSKIHNLFLFNPHLWIQAIMFLLLQW